MGQPTRTTQTTGWRPLNGRLGLRVAVWRLVKVRELGLRLRPTGCKQALSVTHSTVGVAAVVCG